MIRFDVNYGDLMGGQRIREKRIREVFRVVERVLGVNGRRFVSVAFVDEKTCVHLNEAYYGGSGVTDVLSFPFDSDEAVSDGFEEGYLGEILIYYPRALSQAEERGASVMSEIELLLVHGLLHLFGYDHQVLAEERVMFGLQDRVLEVLNK